MKFNWGHKILVLYLSFVVMIGFLVYKSSKQHFDLVSADYYDKEIKYQLQINSIQNTSALPEKPKVNYNVQQKEVEINFPESISSSGIKGEIQFFKPDNAALDFSVALTLDENNKQKIISGKLANGLWKIKTAWTANNTSFYQEQNIFIN